LVKPNELDKNTRLINLNFIPPKFSSTKYFKSEMNNFDKLKNLFQKEFYQKELGKNKIITLIVIIIFIILIFMTFTFITFGDLTGIILSLSLPKIDFYALTYLVIFKTVYFLSIFGFYFLLKQNEEKQTAYNILNSSSRGYNFFIACLVMPFCLHVILTKGIFWLFLYLDKIKTDTKHELNFFYENLFKDIKNVILREKALAVIYLFRLYNLQITMILNSILFLFCNNSCLLFSDKSKRTLVLYFNGEGEIDKFNFSSILIDLQAIFISFLFAQLIYYFNYPIYDNTKHVLDSIFNLYEDKLSKDFKGQEMPSYTDMSKKILENHFCSDFINFDKQSQSFYSSCNYEKIKAFTYLNEVKEL